MGLEVLPVYKLYVCEGEMTNFAIELSLPLAVYRHLGHFYNIPHLRFTGVRGGGEFL